MDIPPLSTVRAERDGQVYEGMLLPSAGLYHIIKLASGYNVGIAREGTALTLVGVHKGKEAPAPRGAASGKKEDIVLLHTGGTIASKVDYATGAVVAGYDPEDLLRRYPHLGPIETEFVANIQSEMMRFAHYNVIAEAIERHVKAGAKAVIVTHGTDTLHYTSAALTFMLGLPVPVVLVGSQRSSDRPSTDAELNITHAVAFSREAIRLGLAGVFVAMHASPEDDEVVILRGVNVRKMHTSRRDAFRSINAAPFARITRDRMVFYEQDAGPHPLARTVMAEKRVGIVKTHPNMYPEEILAYRGFDGVILEGTGLGHAPIDEPDALSKGNGKVRDAIAELVRTGTIVAIAPQTVYGRINLNVYSPQRRLRGLGVIGHGCAMTPETAFVKLAWLLSVYPREKVPALYEADLRGENPRRLGPDGYP